MKPNSSANIYCDYVNEIDNCVYYKDENNCFQCYYNDTDTYFPIQENDNDNVTCILLDITQDNCLILANTKDCKVCDTGYYLQRTEYLVSDIVCSNDITPTTDNQYCKIYQDSNDCDTCEEGYILLRESTYQ